MALATLGRTFLLSFVFALYFQAVPQLLLVVLLVDVSYRMSLSAFLSIYDVGAC